MNLYVSIWCNVLQNALSEELANMKKIQDDLLANKVFFSLNYNAIVKKEKKIQVCSIDLCPDGYIIWY